jgi:hypothetical protein
MVSGGDPDPDEPVLSPEELDIENEEDVAKLDEGRYVIGSDGPPATTDADGSGDDAVEPAAEEAPEPGPADDTDPVDEITGADVKQWLGDELSRHDSTYAYHITAKSGTGVNHQQLATDDIGSAFDGLLVWYARQVAGDTPVDEALGILLGESSVQVRYPTARLIAYLEEQGFGPEDSIADLVSAVSEDDGLVFPRRK